MLLRVVNLAEIAQGSRGGCRYLGHKRAERTAGGGRDTNLDGRTTARHEIGGSGRGCGRVVAPGSSRAVTQRSLPARPKASALRPDPELLPRPTERGALHPERELDDRREQD